MIPGSRIVLLVSVFMLLIDDNQSQLPERKKDGRTDPNNNSVSFIIGQSQQIPVYMYPFRIAVPGMVDSNPVSKYPAYSLNDLGGQCYLRKQVEDLFALFQHFPDQVNIEFCFAAGGNAMQQYRLMLFKLFPDSSRASCCSLFR